MAVLTSAIGIGRGLWPPDEPRVAAIGREMLESASHYVPLLGGKPFLEKPPLYWWAQMPALAHLGPTPLAARLPSVLFSLIAFAAVYAMGRRASGPRAGLLAVAVLATCSQFSEIMHRVLVDPALVAFVATAQAGLLYAASPRSERERWCGSLVAAVSLPLAFLAKGVVGPGLALGPAILYLLVRRRFRMLWDLWPVAALGAAVSVLAIAPWIVGTIHSGPGGWDAVVEIVGANTLGRAIGGARAWADHGQRIWYYLPRAPKLLLPWTVAIPALWQAIRLERNEDQREQVLALVAWGAFGLVLLSLAASKRAIYLTPLIPVFAAAVGWWLAGVRSSSPRRRLDRPTLLVLLSALTVVLPLAFAALLALRFAPVHSELIQALRPGVRPWMLALVGAVAIVGTPLMVRALHRTRQEPAAPPIAWVVVPLLLLFAGYHGVGMRILDTVQDSRLVAAGVASRLAKGEEVGVLRESAVGLVYFDLGVRAHRVSLEEIPAFLEGHGDRVVLLRGRVLRRVPQATRDHLEVVWHDAQAPKREWSLIKWRQP